MSAIITNKFRRESCQSFLDSVDGTYYVGLGKSDPWPIDLNTSPNLDEEDINYSIPLPNSTFLEDRDVLDNLIVLVKYSSKNILVPKNPWSSGRVYKVYDPTDTLLFDLEGTNSSSRYPCYMSHNDNIYVCLDNNDESASTVNPDVTFNDFLYDGNKVFETADGYVWALVQNTSSQSVFNTAEFVPVSGQLSDPTRITSCKNATGGLIYGFKILNSDFNANDSPGNLEIKLRGVDEFGAEIPVIDLASDSRFNVAVINDELTKIAYNDIADDGLLGYARASIEVYMNGTYVPEASIFPLVAPIDGFGFKPSADLPSFYAGINARFNGTVDGEGLVEIPFRQISLIKNAERNDQIPDDQGSQYESTEALDCLDYIQIDPTYESLDEYNSGTIIYQNVSGARAYIDKVDVLNNRIYFHRNSNTDVNFIPFDTTDSLNIGEDTIDANEFESVNEAEYVHNTGDVLFIDHRKKITRDVDQSEDVKIVIQF